MDPTVLNDAIDAAMMDFGEQRWFWQGCMQPCSLRSLMECGASHVLLLDSTATTVWGMRAVQD